MATPRKKHPKKAGRKTTYKPKYCEQIIKYFNREPYEREEVEHSRKDGSTYFTIEYIPCDPPTYEGFATKIGVHRITLLDWCERYPEFDYAYKQCKDFQKNILIINGAKGFYNAPFTIFLASNVTDMKSKVVTENDEKKNLDDFDNSKLDERIEQLLAKRKCEK